MWAFVHFVQVRIREGGETKIPAGAAPAVFYDSVFSASNFSQSIQLIKERRTPLIRSAGAELMYIYGETCKKSSQDKLEASASSCDLSYDLSTVAVGGIAEQWMFPIKDAAKDARRTKQNTNPLVHIYWICLLNIPKPNKRSNRKGKAGPGLAYENDERLLEEEPGRIQWSASWRGWMEMKLLSPTNKLIRFM